MSYLNFFNMNGAPNGGLLIFDPTTLNNSGNLNYFKMATLLAKQLGNMANPLGNQNGAPAGSMTADQHAVKTTSGTVRNAAKGEITALADGILPPGLPEKTSFMDTKFGKFGGQFGGMIGGALSGIANMVGKRGMDGEYGGITKGIDAAYDTVQNIAGKIPGVGLIVSMAMGAGKLLGNAVSKIGGGTDGMTKTDAIMNSAFLNLTPLGLINGFGGKKAKTYVRNKELDTQTNGGFLGFLATLDVTLIGAGKKYGLFSSGARKKQNELTEFTLNMKHTISGIVDTNTINNLAAQGSTPFLAQQLAVDLSGGIQQMRAARHGMLFSRRVVSKYLMGNKIGNNDPRVKAMQARFGTNLEKLKLNVNNGAIKPISKEDSRALDMNKRFGYNRQSYTDLATTPTGTIMQRYNVNKPATSPTSYSEELTFPEVNKPESNMTPLLQNNNQNDVSKFNPNEMYVSNFMNTLPSTATSMKIEQPTWDKDGVTQLKSTLLTALPNILSFNYTTPGIQSVISGWGRRKNGFINNVIGRYLQGNKLKRSIQSYDIATGKYVDLPTDLTKEQVQGKLPIKLANGTVVFMLKNGMVTSDRWETVGEREHLTPKGLGGMKTLRHWRKPVNWSELKIPYSEWVKDVNPEYLSPNYDLRLAYLYLPKEDLERWKFGVNSNDPKYYANYKDESGNYIYHLGSIAQIPNSEDYVFLKKGTEKTNPELHWETDSYHNGKNGLKSTHKLSYEGDRYYYRRVPNHKNGEFKLNGHIVSEYKQGGQMNVIPEGALHARLNHLDLINDDLTHVTTKGIPVITKEGGEVVQHAEIEHSEIIFTLDVTNKIENLRKKWHEDKEDKYAIEAGKLLVKEILHNTDDRTNLIESVE